MGEEMEVGCAHPTGGSVGESSEAESNKSESLFIAAYSLCRHQNPIE